ncbi:MAG: DUF4982 domain-containing protein [Clostridiales bacterium]|nr:DUF4982 domain-containing protein [Clostridiales bacterium]
MLQYPFNTGWTCRRADGSGSAVPVTLPHDAQCREPRGADSPGQHNIGWFQCYDYEYRRRFPTPEGWRGKRVVFEFEGVYRDAEVILNGDKIAAWPYGYTNFYADATDALRSHGENELVVLARNARQPNSRWYSGTGIYRPVSVWVGDEAHIPVNGIKVHTTALTPPTVEVTVSTSRSGLVAVELLDGDAVLASAAAESDGAAALTLSVPGAELWSCDHPKCYTCRATFAGDTAEAAFGFRLLAWDSKRGLTVNGRRVILRGACIHHDNGPLGAVCDPQAEERKVRLLRENGYNAIRSAHNPCSKALLDACDRLGMLVMDEFVDCWYIHKTKYDYVNDFPDWWQRDLKAMVEKDYNHPSVILYSTGNEVSETAQPKGIALTGEMTDYLHSLDGTRPVTCGVNIFFNFLSSIGFGVYSDDKAEKAASEQQKQPEKKKKPVGSEFYNTLATVLGDKTMKIGATLPPCDWKTRNAFANMDIAGYNYGIYRYRHDLKKYPDRLILGSETFCADACAFWELAKTEPRIIGDFVWAGMDYIGETGTGRWGYLDYPSQPPSDDPGWLTAGAGRVNLLGDATAEAAYTRVAFELERGPILAVRPVAPVKKPPVGAWSLTDALMSWSWRGCAGNPAEVEVYARGASVELLLNGETLGRKKLTKDCRAVFRTTYQDGTLTARSYDESGALIAAQTLETAGEDTVLQLTPEQPAVQPGGLSYIHLRYTDGRGIWKPMERHTLRAAVTGGELLGFGSASSYNPEGYWGDTIRTYWGEALAVLRADGSGPLTLTVTDEDTHWQVTVPCLS